MLLLGVVAMGLADTTIGVADVDVCVAAFAVAISATCSLCFLRC